MIKSVRGTRDLLPPETALWNFVEAAARDVFRAYNFQEIRTPVLEDLSLFQRSVGEETDIVSKEMFAWQDRGRAESDKGQWLALRPENTAGVVRAYIEHKLWERPGVQKLFYIGPQFRRERPQKGRYRQFYQIGAEAIGPPAAGSESPARDAEVLEMLVTLLERLGIQDWTLQLNSVGCASDRPRYHEALRAALAPVVAGMCADCERRAVTNPLRVFDCKVPEDQPIIERLPTINQFLDEPCKTHFAEVQRILTALDVPFVLNDRLVRGLDYYEKTAFEFTHGALGAQNAILGGGRYDGLSETLGGPRAPGIGFAIGEDRLVLALQDQMELINEPPLLFIAPIGKNNNGNALRIAQIARRNGITAEVGEGGFKISKSLDLANSLGCRYFLAVGDTEVKDQRYQLQELATGAIRIVSEDNIPAVITRPSTETTPFTSRKVKRTPQQAYYLPILQALSSLGGRGTVRQVLEMIEVALKNQLTDADYERLSYGEFRWRNTARWARQTLAKRGLLKGEDLPSGTWEITEFGRLALQDPRLIESR